MYVVIYIERGGVKCRTSNVFATYKGAAIWARGLPPSSKAKVADVRIDPEAMSLPSNGQLSTRRYLERTRGRMRIEKILKKN